MKVEKMSSFVEEKSTGFAETIMIDRVLEWQIAGGRERFRITSPALSSSSFSHCYFPGSSSRKKSPLLFSKMDLWSEPMTKAFLAPLVVEGFCLPCPNLVELWRVLQLFEAFSFIIRVRN